MLIAGDRFFKIIRSSRAGQNSRSGNALKLRPLAAAYSSTLYTYRFPAVSRRTVDTAQVQITERVDRRVEVTAEHDDLGDRQQPGRVGVVGTGMLDHLAEEARSGRPADWLPETRVRQRVALDRGGPPLVTCGVCQLAAPDVSRCLECVHLIPGSILACAEDVARDF